LAFGTFSVEPWVDTDSATADQDLRPLFAQSRAEPDLASPVGFIAFDQPITGEGWHDLEYTAAGEPYCWSGPTRESQIMLPLAPELAYTFSVRIVHALSLDTLHSLQVMANDIPLSLTAITEPDGAARFTTVIPAEIISPKQPFVRLAFLVDQTTQPEGDDRTVGLAIGACLVEPIVGE
jgi:hypothetical protein